MSLSRTRALIDLCITDYLESLLEDTQEQLSNDYRPPSSSISNAVNNPEQPDVVEAEIGEHSRLRPKIKSRSPSDSTLSPRHPIRNGETTLLPGLAPDPFEREMSAVQYTQSREEEFDPEGDRAPKSSRTPTNSIFRTLESYILGSFAGCAALNASFFTVRPQPAQRRGSADELMNDHSKDLNPSATEVEHDPFSEIDAKTLLLGDVAENGSWWAGGRMHRLNIATSRERERSPETWRGIVSAKTPRINWSELAQWFQMVIHAADAWPQKWQELKPPNGESATDISAKWERVPANMLQDDFAESQIHLQRILLKATENLLKRPGRPLTHPEDCRFLLMLLANPLLYTSSSAQVPKSTTNGITRDGMNTLEISPSKHPRDTSRKRGPLGHHSGILKRTFGLLANLSNEIHQFLVAWMSRFSDSHFQRLVDLVGSFVTYRLSRQPNRRHEEPVNPTEGLVPSFSDSGLRHPSELHAALELRPKSSTSKAVSGKPQLSRYSEDWQIKAAARVMALLFAANAGNLHRRRGMESSLSKPGSSLGENAKGLAHAPGQILPISNFYNTMLDYADLLADFETWETTKTKFTFCQYPFFLSIYAKIHILEHDAKRQMEIKAREAFFDSILSKKAISQFLVLKVRRDCLVEDSLRSVSEVVGSGADEIKKGLKIDFVGEEGIDAGGLRKEWFLLLVREIFDPHHGLFVYDEDSQLCYFNPFCFESSEQFFLVGVLLGLAIYNSTILDVAFPPFVFKKLLASAPTSTAPTSSMPKIAHSYSLEDLAEYRPSLAHGLQSLLGFEGDVQETFCRDFVIEMDRYGENVRMPLCPGGERKPVTNANRREFVDLYIHHLLDVAVARQYEPFKRGFFTVCGGNALSLFRPEEIELLIRGSDEALDISSLRAVALYEGWPKDSPPERQPQVVWFWEFFERAEPVDQRKILSFITGSDRIPAMGATNLNIRVVLLRSFDGKGNPISPTRLPTARTCFNTISLYAYETREKLEEKLWTAVLGSEGFGLK